MCGLASVRVVVVLVDVFLCPYRDVPCDSRFVDDLGHGICFVKGARGKVIYVCVWVRFKGANSVRDVGLGMTIYEKLERAGLIPK